MLTGAGPARSLRSEGWQGKAELSNLLVLKCLRGSSLAIAPGGPVSEGDRKSPRQVCVLGPAPAGLRFLTCSVLLFIPNLQGLY